MLSLGEYKLNLKKGDEVTILTKQMSNASRYLPPLTEKNIDDWIRKGVVEKVGRKYITLEDKSSFVIDDYYNEKWNRGGADYCLVPSKEFVLKEIRKSDIKREVEKLMKEDISLESLEKIIDILNKEFCK